jgi:hypothetical protein
MRPVALNGIGDVVSRPDLLDRALIINLPRIRPEDRRAEKDLEAKVEAAKPSILGALFDAVAAGLGQQASVRLGKLPRMADFARWGVATEQALGGEEGSFLKAYQSSQDEAVETALEAYPIAAILLDFAKGYTVEDPWEGTPTDLFDALNDKVGDEIKRARDWPKAPNRLMEQLGRLAPSLQEVGVHVMRTGRSKHARKMNVFSQETPGE